MVHGVRHSIAFGAISKIVLIAFISLALGSVTSVSAAPLADFSGSPTIGGAPLAVTFTDLSIGEITGWSWDFDNDGTEDSILQNPSHVYSSPGNYTVSLTVTDIDGPATVTKTDYITVNDPPPVAEFSADTTSGSEPLTVNFTDLSTGTATGWSWDFDNDGVARQQRSRPAILKSKNQ
jgi:PKD repeat protein